MIPGRASSRHSKIRNFWDLQLPGKVLGLGPHVCFSTSAKNNIRLHSFQDNDRPLSCGMSDVGQRCKCRVICIVLGFLGVSTLNPSIARRSHTIFCVGIAL